MAIGPLREALIRIRKPTKDKEWSLMFKEGTWRELVLWD